MRKIKRKKIKIKNIIILCIILIIIIAIFICSFKFTKKKEGTNKLIGEWTTDNITIYKFNKNNTGVLIVPLSEYKFSYKIEKIILSIDFEDDKYEDTKYKYSFEDSKLILKGNNGKFVFKKKK